MCIRGELDICKKNFRTDSPTATHQTVKLALAIAANGKYVVKCRDMGSSSLQVELKDVCLSS